MKWTTSQSGQYAGVTVAMLQRRTLLARIGTFYIPYRSVTTLECDEWRVIVC